MIKPEKLSKGDKVAIVSLSRGSVGESKNLYRYENGKKVLEDIFGLKVVAMPNALKGTKWVEEHPELRAKDLMDAFKDKSIKAIITMVGGDDTIRLLPYIDFDVIRNNPKIFMGFSDTTANHFMMHKAGLVSFYGPALAVELSFENVIPETLKTMQETLFEKHNRRELNHFGIYANDPIDWSNRKLDIHKDELGYEVLQGKGKVTGELMGGCLTLFQMINGTEIWPKLSEWENKILVIETSESLPTPTYLKWTLLNLGAQGILNKINGIIVGRPKDGKFYDEYKDIYKQVLKAYGKEDLPVLYNCHFGHAWLWNILPLGCKVEIDCENKYLTLIENCVE